MKRQQEQSSHQGRGDRKQALVTLFEPADQALPEAQPTSGHFSYMNWSFHFIEIGFLLFVTKGIVTDTVFRRTKKAQGSPGAREWAGEGCHLP